MVVPPALRERESSGPGPYPEPRECSKSKRRPIPPPASAAIKSRAIRSYSIPATWIRNGSIPKTEKRSSTTIGPIPTCRSRLSTANATSSRSATRRVRCSATGFEGDLARYVVENIYEALDLPGRMGARTLHGAAVLHAALRRRYGFRRSNRPGDRRTDLDQRRPAEREIRRIPQFRRTRTRLFEFQPAVGRLQQWHRAAQASAPV